jgi:hypothetical protein
VGNPSTEERIDVSARVPCAHGFGIISHQLYEVIMLVKICINNMHTLCIIVWAGHSDHA